MIKSTVLQVLAIALLALVSSAYGHEWKAFLRKKNEPEPAASDKKIKSAGNVVLKLEGPESGSGPMVWEPMGLDIPALSGSFSFHIEQFMLNISVISKDKLDAEAYYVNIHTNKYPDGELRGQFKAVIGE
eukprot:gene2711-12581_t